MCFHSLLLDCETPEAELRPKNRDLPEPSSAPGQGESERARREGGRGQGWGKAEGRGEKPLPTDSYRQGQLCTTRPHLDVHGHGALCPPSTAPHAAPCAWQAFSLPPVGEGLAWEGQRGEGLGWGLGQILSPPPAPRDHSSGGMHPAVSACGNPISPSRLSFKSATSRKPTLPARPLCLHPLSQKGAPSSPLLP